jgi:hypothetical protein
MYSFLRAPLSTLQHSPDAQITKETLFTQFRVERRVAVKT